MYTFSWLPYESCLEGKFRVYISDGLASQVLLLRVPYNLDKLVIMILSPSDFARNMVCVSAQ